MFNKYWKIRLVAGRPAIETSELSEIGTSYI